MGAFIPIVANRFQRHFAAAERLARTVYMRDHSNDQTGAEHEDVPQWARSFFTLFDGPQRRNQAAQERDQRRQTATSLVGC